jgi:polyisoprenoid-binding protein YceI
MSANKSNWIIDPAHSEIQFKVKHLVIANVTGSFDKFEGSLETSREDFSDAVIAFSADINSINTKMPDRNAHLKSADFFDAANYPKLTFKSISLQKKKDDEYDLLGDLTIRGISQPVKLGVTFGGIMKDPWGNVKAGFELNGKVNRKDFSLNWNAITEAGGMVVSDEVRIMANVELARQ